MITKSKSSLVCVQGGETKIYFRLSVLTNLLLQFLSLFSCFFQCFSNFNTDSLSAAQFILQTESHSEVTRDN